LIAIIAGAGLLWNRVPPLFFDSLAYHFAQPDLWLVTQRIAPEPWSLHSWFPPGMSVMYGVGLALGGYPLANDANLLMGLLVVGLAFDLARRLWSPGAGLAAALLVPTYPVLLYAMAIPAADLGHGAFSAASLGALLLGGAEDRERWTRRAAWLCGGALLTKYLALLVPLAVGAVWVMYAAAPRSGAPARARRIRAAALFVLPALCLFIPWLAANTIAVRNPVAPVLSSVLPPEGLADGGAASFRSDARGGLPGADDLQRLLPRLILGDAEESRLYPTPAWGWMPLLLPLGLLLLFRTDRRLTQISALALGLFALWFLTFRWERFLVATTFLIAVATGGALALAWQRGRVFRMLTLAAALLGAGTLIPACQEVVRFTGALPVALGREDGAAFLERSFPTFELYREANDALEPRSTRVLIVGEMRHYGLALRRSAPSGFNTHPLMRAMEAGGPAQETNRRLRAMGFTHVVVDRAWIERSSRRYPSLSRLHERPDLLEPWLHSLGRPVAARGTAALYRVPA